MHLPPLRGRDRSTNLCLYPIMFRLSVTICHDDDNDDDDDDGCFYLNKTLTSADWSLVQNEAGNVVPSNWCGRHQHFWDQRVDKTLLFSLLRFIVRLDWRHSGVYFWQMESLMVYVCGFPSTGSYSILVWNNPHHLLSPLRFSAQYLFLCLSLRVPLVSIALRRSVSAVFHRLTPPYLGLIASVFMNIDFLSVSFYDRFITTHLCCYLLSSRSSPVY